MVRESTSNIAIEDSGSEKVSTAAPTSAKFTANLDDDDDDDSNRTKIDECGSLKTTLLADSISLSEGSSETTRDGKSDSFVPKGCQFSPDGTCLLTAKGNKLELYNTPYENDEDDTDVNENESNSTSNTILRWKPVITCHSGESVRSYTWYPHMKSSDPASCCFLGVSRDSPVQLYDAYSGNIRATYSPYNALDEMESPTTLCFVENGQKLVTGGLRSDRVLHVFDINRPGRENSPPLLRLGKTRRSKDGQKGLVSAMAYSEFNGVLAVGTYSPGSIYLYDLRTYSRSAVSEIVMSSSATASSGGTICVAGHGKKGGRNKRKRFVAAYESALTDTNGNSDSDGNIINNIYNVDNESNFSAAKLQWYHSRTRGGVTQVEFENNNGNITGGNYLFSTSRRSNAILQWDLRKLSSSGLCPGIASFKTANDTNQRIEFQVRGDQLWAGGIDGCVRVYSYRKSNRSRGPLLAKLDGFRDCVNGISLHPDTDMESLLKKSKAQIGSTTKDSEKASGALLAVAVGRRHFPSESDLEEDDPQASLTNRTSQLVGSTQLYSLEGVPNIGMSYDNTRESTEEFH